MRWLEISTHVDTETVEPLSEVFRRYVYGGISIEQEIEPFAEGDGYCVRTDSPVTVKGYVPMDEDADSKVKAIEEALWHLSLLRPTQPLVTRVVDEDDWKEAWKKFYDVHRIGKHVVIKPSWKEYEPREGDVVVAIDPGMAFGTGLHPTTQMCLVEIENRVKPGQTVLDVGTGSGILSIAAARLGAREVVSLDIDTVAVDAARSNVELNELQEVVSVEVGSLPASPEECHEEFDRHRGRYDVVLANIIANVITTLSRSLAAAIKNSGIVIASGIIGEKSGLVKDSLMAEGLRIVAEAHSGDWVTLVAEKAHA